MPWFVPEEYLKYYPRGKVLPPYNPQCPSGMPSIAWSKQPIMKYSDCRPKAVGKRNVGNKCVAWPQWKTRALRRKYYAAVSYADNELGRVLHELKAQRLENDTIVVFFGDHGWQLGEHAKWAKQTNFEIATR